MNHLAAGGVVGARHLTLVVSAVPGTRVSDKAVNKPSNFTVLGEDLYWGLLLDTSAFTIRSLKDRVNTVSRCEIGTLDKQFG